MIPRGRRRAAGTRSLSTGLANRFVEGVDRLRVHVIEPRRERPIRAQFAPVFVGNHIIGVIGPDSVEPEVTNRATFQGLARDDTVGSIRVAMRPEEQSADIGSLHRSLIPVGWRDPGRERSTRRSGAWRRSRRGVRTHQP